MPVTWARKTGAPWAIAGGRQARRRAAGFSLAALLGAALLLSGCGQAVPQLQLASPSASAQTAATAPGTGALPASPAESGSPKSSAARARASAPANTAGSGSAATAPVAAGAPALRSVEPKGKPAASSSPPASTTSLRHALPAAARLIIPKIGVNAPIVTLGVDPNGLMEVPSNGTDVGWYSFSAVPGAPGNAVISGHLDTTTARAVFWQLGELRHKDAVSIVEDGKRTDFQVFWSKSWPDATAPLPLILGSAPSPTLTLITCAGTFDRSAKNYSNRLVVRAKLPGSV